MASVITAVCLSQGFSPGTEINHFIGGQIQYWNEFVLWKKQNGSTEEEA
jgi:hypothetical protein